MIRSRVTPTRDAWAQECRSCTTVIPAGALYFRALFQRVGEDTQRFSLCQTCRDNIKCSTRTEGVA